MNTQTKHIGFYQAQRAQQNVPLTAEVLTAEQVLAKETINENTFKPKRRKGLGDVLAKAVAMALIAFFMTGLFLTMAKEDPEVAFAKAQIEALDAREVLALNKLREVNSKSLGEAGPADLAEKQRLETEVLPQIKTEREQIKLQMSGEGSK